VAAPAAPPAEDVFRILLQDVPFAFKRVIDQLSTPPIMNFVDSVDAGPPANLIARL
jgi:hypothetical protein